MANSRYIGLRNVCQKVGGMFYTIVLVACGVLILLFLANHYVPKTRNDPFLDYDWSEKWSPYDKKARVGADCKPIYTIQRKMGQISTWIWVVPKTCEQGLPHTRSIDVIAMPISLPKARVPEILEHEKIHLLQRQMPDSWARFYKIKWDYELYGAPPAGMPAELQTMIRANPDTASAPWCCWRKRWWPVPIYQSSTNLSLRNAIVKWWDQETMNIESRPPDAWQKFFGSHIHQSEHPHEITAEYLSGPLFNGAMPANPSEAMLRLRAGWTEADPMYPTVV